jgi:NAD(P)-dependent dehydrogenase (short-subunit alcohol dehydrogenase family)
MRVVTVSRREDADVAGDASNETIVRRAIDLAGSLGSIRLLVNSAGSGTFAPAGGYDEESVRRMLDANLVAMILFCDALFPRFARNGGTIVNILSTAALHARAGESVYAASKWGARGYTEVLKSEAKGTKARVLSVSPGGMQTPFWPEERVGYMDARGVAETIVEAIESPVKITDLVIER